MSQFPNNGGPPQGLNPAMLMQARPPQTQQGYAPQVPTMNPQAMMAAQNGVNPAAFAAVRPQVVNPAAMSMPVGGAMAPGLQPTTMGVAPAVISPGALSVPPVQAAPPIPSPQPVATPTLPPVTPSAPPPPTPAPPPATTPQQPAAPAPAPAPVVDPAPGQPAVPLQILPMLSMFYAAQYHQILSQQAAVTPGTPVPPPYTPAQAQQLFLALTPTQQRQVQTNFIARQRLAQQAQQAQQQAQQAGTAPAQAAGQPPAPAGAAPPAAQPSPAVSASSTAPATPTPATTKPDKPKAEKAAKSAAASGSAATPAAGKKNAPVRPRPPKEPKKAAPEKGKDKGKSKEKDKDKDGEKDKEKEKDKPKEKEKDKGKGKSKEQEADKDKDKEKVKTKDKDGDKTKDAQATAEAARASAVTRDNTPDVETYTTSTDPRRLRKEEGGFRGSMRGEIARLMYAAGDVVDPDVDSVDYIEDLVIEFLADLCRPVPPIRANVNSARLAVPLSADIVRHRLATHSHLRKFLERWDHMAYMSADLQQSRRVAAPSHTDLIQTVGKQFLGLDGEQESGIGVKRRMAAADLNADGDVVKRRGRPPKNPEERKKPGPKKGWKKNLDPNAIPKKRAPQSRPYKKKDRPQSASMAPSPRKPA